MEPALKAGQLVLARRTKNIKVGDIIIFKHDNLEKIKRVSSVEKASIIVLGDNKKSSTDSRSFGPIQTEDIIAKVIFSI